MQEAEAAERADPPMVSTCREIVRTVVDYGVEKDDWKKTWKADAQVSLHPSHLSPLQDALPVSLLAAKCSARIINRSLPALTWQVLSFKQIVIS